MPEDTESVRANAVQMSRDLVAMIDSEGGPVAREETPDNAIREYVRALLRAELATEQERLKRIGLLEEAGHRIVDGGQTSEDSWEITDWRSGAVLASGADGIDGYAAVRARLDPEGKWFHIDRVDRDEEDEDEDRVDHNGVPESLASALQDWLGMISTSDEDVATVAGWTVEEVQQHRAYEH